MQEKQSKMYELNKQLNKQQSSFPAERLVVSEKNLARLKMHEVLVQSIDPGVVTTASVACLGSKRLFEDINRYQALSTQESRILFDLPGDQVTYDITTNMVNQATMSTSHRKEREKRSRNDKQLNEEDLKRKRVTRKIRNKRFYKRFMSNKREEVFNRLGFDSKCPMFTFVGNWSRNAMYLRGHTQRSLKPVITRLKSVEKDEVHIVDEFRSTITCSSCFEVTSKQIVRAQDGKKRRVKGAVVCSNPLCPRRVSTRCTTINRDGNGARNIALIGITSIISTDGRPLPPFQRGVYKSNKYV